jgi:hypothetical protein
MTVRVNRVTDSTHLYKLGKNYRCGSEYVLRCDSLTTCSAINMCSRTLSRNVCDSSFDLGHVQLHEEAAIAEWLVCCSLL